MEMNKDEALRCCDIAARLLREGDYARAEKFVQKSLKLFPTEQAGGTRQNSILKDRCLYAVHVFDSNISSF